MQPLNLGSTEMVSMNEMMEIASGFKGEKALPIKHIPGPEGVRGRNSENSLILSQLGWEPTVKLADGLKLTYDWINVQVRGPCRAAPKPPAACSLLLNGQASAGANCWTCYCNFANWNTRCDKRNFH